MSLNSKIWHPLTQEKTAAEPIKISHAKGENLYTQDNQKIIDMIASWWINPHGHADPTIARAIYEQAQRLEQVIFAGFTHEPAEQLANTMISTLGSPFNKIFFSENGSSAVEIALKMTYQYWHNQGEGHRTKFLSFEGAYHGDTFGAMAVGQKSGFFDPFAKLLFEVDFMPMPHTHIGDQNIEERENKALAYIAEHVHKHHHTIAGMIVEPLIQAAGGMRLIRPRFIDAVSNIMRQYNILIIMDECMTGFCKTGKMFAIDHLYNKPDIICLSKALTGGFLPLSLTTTTDKIYNAFLDDSFSKAFAHSHSFTANPIGCAAANASLALFKTNKSLEKVLQIEQEYKLFSQKLSALPNVEKIRIMGSMLAFDVKTKDPHSYSNAIGQELKAYFLSKGLLIRPLGNTVYLLPPFCIDIKNSLHFAFDTIYAKLKM